MKFTTFLIVLTLGVIHWLAVSAWMSNTGLGYWAFWSAGLQVWWDYHRPRLLVAALAAAGTAILVKLIWR